MRTMHRIVLSGSEDPDGLGAPDVGIAAARPENVSCEADSMIRPASREARLTMLLCGFSAWCGVSAAEPTATEQDLMARRVQPCTVCHGEVGRATPDGYYPRIAGKPTGYLLNEMRNFRDGRRTFPQMVYFMQLRNDADLEEVANYFARQRLPYASPAPPKVTPSVIEHGRNLILRCWRFRYHRGRFGCRSMPEDEQQRGVTAPK